MAKKKRKKAAPKKKKAVRKKKKKAAPKKKRKAVAKKKGPPKVQPLKVVKYTKKILEELDIDDDPGWYIEDPNNVLCGYLGPYDTKAEATEDRIGQQKFWRENKWLLRRN